MTEQSQTTNITPDALRELKDRADRALARYENEAALELYTRALELLSPGDMGSAPTECELLLGQAACHYRLGDFPAEAADLQAALELARSLGDAVRQVRAGSELSLVQYYLGEREAARRTADDTVAVARSVGDRQMLADALLGAGAALVYSGAGKEGERALEAALALQRELGDRAGEARSLVPLAWSTLFAHGDRLAAQEAYERVLALARQAAHREHEAEALLGLSLAATDQAVKRAYGEQALVLFEALGMRYMVGRMRNNLSLLCWHLGLYRRGREHARLAVQMARDAGTPPGLAARLDSLARLHLALGDYGEARRAWEEGLAVARRLGADGVVSAASDVAGLGYVALMEGQPHEARATLEEALGSEVELRGADRATFLAWLAKAHLALGDWPAAKRRSAEAVEQLEAAAGQYGEFPPQEVWWVRYRVLTHAGATCRGEALGDAGTEVSPAETSPNASPLPAEAADDPWACLDRAHTLMLDAIATLSDEGLLRNYLNKVELSRNILLEWTRVAMARGVALPAPTPRAGNVQDQLRRMMDTSARMNEERDVDALLDFVIDEMVELNGAERSFLVLVDEEEQPVRWVARGVAPEEMAEAQAAATAMLARVTKTRQGVLVGADAADPDLTGLRRPVRSSLAAPLVAQGRLIGLLYADIRPIFGAFDQADLDLLSVFAGQAATAIENARLYQGLEARVAERTQELAASNASLEHRNAELSIISSVQQALASQLDMQAIYELVGDKIREIFDAQVVGIATYDPDTNMVHIPYGIEKGQRFYAEPFPLPEGGAGAHLLRTRRPLLVNRCVSEPPSEFVIEDAVPGTEPPRSLLWVPLLAASDVWGGISLQNVDHEDAFSEADVRLLSTLAASMSVALENARAYRRLEELDRAKSRFVRLVAHELRSPLSAIQSLLDVTLEGYAGAVNEKGRELMQRAQRRLEFLLTLVDDLLELAAGRMENLERERAQVDLRLVCRRVVDLLQARASEKGVALHLEVAPGSYLLWGAAERLEGLLTNLVSNAVKYTPPGGHVQVRLRREGGTIVCSVADTGIGIPEEALPHLFEEFYRAPNARALEKEGTGLGLAIAQQAAREHGGRLEVESKLGEGTVFTVTLQALP